MPRRLAQTVTVVLLAQIALAPGARALGPLSPANLQVPRARGYITTLSAPGQEAQLCYDFRGDDDLIYLGSNPQHVVVGPGPRFEGRRRRKE